MGRKRFVSLELACIITGALGLMLAWSHSPTFVPVSDVVLRQIWGLNPGNKDDGTQTCADVNTGGNIVTPSVCQGMLNPPAGTKCVKCADVQTTHIIGGTGGGLFKNNAYLCNGIRSYAACLAGQNGLGVCAIFAPNGNCTNGFTVWTLQ